MTTDVPGPGAQPKKTTPGPGHQRPRLLDLFCGAGGCSVGYHRAGFDVVGVDNRPQPRYPYTFVQADAMRFPLDGFDAIHASPPCQDHSSLNNVIKVDHESGWMLPATRDRLRSWGGTYVIENVPGAPMVEPLMLCGASFGLYAGGYALRRHRLFESNVFLMGPGCACPRRILGVYGDGGPGLYSRGRKASSGEARALMGIDWMNRREISQAIPPAYTQFIGEQLLTHLARAA